MNKTGFSTLIGYVALFIWATVPSLVMLLQNIPTFEILTVAFSVCFAATLIRLTVTKQFYKIKQPIMIWAVGALGVFGNEAFFIAASKHAPSSQITIIYYLWPLFVFLASCFLPKEKLALRYLIGSVIALIGIYIGLNNGELIKASYYRGYLFALASALVWSFYTVVSSNFKNTPTEMIGMYCGIGAVCSALIHFSCEASILPSIPQGITLIIMGFTTEGLAYFLWDHGVKKGNYRLLCLLSYGNPMIAILLMILLGLAEPTAALVTACILVTLGNLIGELRWKSSDITSTTAILTDA